MIFSIAVTSPPPRPFTSSLAHPFQGEGRGGGVHAPGRPKAAAKDSQEGEGCQRRSYGVSRRFDSHFCLVLFFYSLRITSSRTGLSKCGQIVKHGYFISTTTKTCVVFLSCVFVFFRLVWDEGKALWSRLLGMHSRTRVLGEGICCVSLTRGRTGKQLLALSLIARPPSASTWYFGRISLMMCFCIGKHFPFSRLFRFVAVSASREIEREIPANVPALCINYVAGKLLLLNESLLVLC